MQGNITIKNIDIRFNVEEFLKHLATIVSKQREKEILFDLIKTLSSHNVETLRIMGEILVQMKEVLDKFYINRVEEYRRSQKLRKIFGFTSSAKIEKRANELALADVKQLTDIITGSEDKINAFRANNEAIQQAIEQLISLVRDKTINLDVRKLNKMLEADYEIK